MNNTLEITTLGGLEIRVGGERVTGFYSRKVEALLVYLVSTGRPQSRDVLADLLWDDVTQSRAMGNLRVVLHNLREKLGPYVEITRTTVAMNQSDPSAGSAKRPRTGQAVWFDVAELEDGLASPTVEQVADALSLYQGDFLAGFYVRDCPRFEEWQLVEQERLRSAVMEALGDLVAHFLESGTHDLALVHARRLLELDTLLEQAHRQVMRCLAYLGQRSAALAHYEGCLRILDEELGVEPEAETTALYEAILAGEVTTPEAAQPSPHNLPPLATPFIGRERELTELHALLSDADAHLVTVVGPGGAGKTRLALEVAEAQLDRFEHGVYFVPLAPLESAASIVPAIADALGFSFVEGEGQQTALAPTQQLLAFLRDKNLLLVLDNYEHLLDGADVASDVVRAAPQVVVLVTSRISLNLQEEQLFPLEGMAFPGWETPEDTAAYSAVKLFLESARRVRPDFEAKGDELIFLTRICRLVDGMPLGVQLAAGWVDTLTPAQIAAEIRRSLDFLETEQRNVPERQRSMRAAFDHSWVLLTERDQEIVQALSVFRGGFTRDAAQAVSGASLRDLRALVNKSLLQFVPRSGAETGQGASEGRYDVHELLRQYAQEKLDATPDGGAGVRDRHSAHFCAALERWAEAVKGPGYLEALEELQADNDNVRVAWAWSVQEGLVSRLGQAAEGMGWDLFHRDRPREGELAFREAADRLAALEQQPASQFTGKVDLIELKKVRSTLLAWQAAFCSTLGLRESARKLSGASAALLDDPVLAEVDTRRERAWVLYVATGCTDFSDWEQLERLFQQSLSLYRALGDRHMTAMMLGFMGTFAEFQGDYPLARRRREESLALRQEIGDAFGVMSSQVSLDYVALIQGHLEQGERLVQRSRSMRASHGGRLRTSGLFHSATASYYIGRFAQAQASFSQDVATYDELMMHYHRRAFMGYISLGFSELHRGQHEAASAQAEQTLTRAQESDNLWVAGAGRALAGAVALAQEAYGDAYGHLQRAAEKILQPGVTPAGCWPSRLQVQATLGYAARSVGEGVQVKEQLAEVLRRGSEVRDYLGVLTALPAVALLLVDGGESERAVELYAVASGHGYVANSQWFEDVAGKEIAGIAATLPPDVVAAAQERGRARDLWETASELLQELR